MPNRKADAGATRSDFEHISRQSTKLGIQKNTYMEEKGHERAHRFRSIFSSSVPRGPVVPSQKVRLDPPVTYIAVSPSSPSEKDDWIQPHIPPNRPAQEVHHCQGVVSVMSGGLPVWRSQSGAQRFSRVDLTRLNI